MAILTRLRRSLEARFAGWVRRRQGEDALPVGIHRRRLYILPTQAGAGFAVLLFGMLLAGLNYANSLALLVTFLLGGLTLVAMHLAHRNLLGVRIVGARVEPAFAGDESRLEIVFDAGCATRVACALLWRDVGGESRSLPVDALRGEQAAATVSLPAPRRGVYEVGRIRVASTWPFGFFRVWTWLHLPLERVVYPAARGTLSRRLATMGTSTTSQATTNSTTISDVGILIRRPSSDQRRTRHATTEMTRQVHARAPIAQVPVGTHPWRQNPVTDGSS